MSGKGELMRYRSELLPAQHYRYWLVDIASLPPNEVLQRYYAWVDVPSFRWLYANTAYHHVRDVGPVLLDITQAEEFFQHHQTEWLHQAASLVIDTPLSLEALQQRLAAFVTVDLGGPGMGLFRFHEPVALHLLLGEGLLSEPRRHALVGPETRWAWALCQCREGLVYETHDVSDTVESTIPALLPLDDAIQQRLAKGKQLSRLMPLLGAAVDRFGLRQDPEAMSRLWLSLEHYWHANRDAALPLKRVVGEAHRMLEQAESLEHLEAQLESSSTDESRRR